MKPIPRRALAPPVGRALAPQMGEQIRQRQCVLQGRPVAPSDEGRS